MNLVLVGASHRRTPVDLREQLHLAPDDADRLARELAGPDGEAVVLSTCNRTELYLAHHDPDAAAVRARAALTTLAPEVASRLYVLAGEEAAVHLFRVAAGLDSMVTGEPEILAQVRAARERSRVADAAGPALDRLFDQALRAGKRVRTETAISQSPASVPAAAARRIAAFFGDLAGKRVLVIGAGRMAELLAVNLRSRGVESIVVASRTRAGAEALARRVEGRAAGLESVVDELADADVVVSATSARGLAVSVEDVERRLFLRGGRPLLLVDVAVPRDIDPRVAELPGCSLYDIDDLEQIVVAADASRRGEAAHAAAIVEQEAERFRAWQRSLLVAPVIASLRQRAEEIRVSALEACGDLGPRERELVSTVTSQIVAKLLHEPMIELKRNAGKPAGALYAEAVERLFGLRAA